MPASRTTVIPSLRVSFDEATLRRGAADLAGITNGMPRAVSGAINKMLPKMRTQVTREFAAVLTAKPNNIRNRITANNKATPQKLSGSISILRRQIGLINFKFKEKRKKTGWGKASSGSGVEVQIYKDRPALRFPHAFVAKPKDYVDEKGDTIVGNRHIFQRVMNAAGKRVKRGPLVSLKGISLMHEFQKRTDMQARVQRFIGEQAPKELKSQVDRLLSRKKTDA